MVGVNLCNRKPDHLCLHRALFPWCHRALFPWCHILRAFCFPRARHSARICVLFRAGDQAVDGFRYLSIEMIEIEHYI